MRGKGYPMTTKEAVKTVVRMAQEREAESEEGEALRLVLSALKERDKIAVTIESPVRIMERKLAEVMA